MQPFDELAQERLIELLDAKAESSRTMRTDEAQAFMLALLSGPDELEISDWLPEILGDESLFNDSEREEAEQLALAMMADMRREMEGGKLPDLWFYHEDNGDVDFFTWCNAYLYALDVVPTDWFAHSEEEEFEDLFYPLMALSGVYDADTEAGTPAILELSDKDLVDLQAELPRVLLDIYQYWRAVVNTPKTIHRKSSKTGRNESCPCGSGKKYKHCCGR